ncbi:PilZ domain protein [Geotalea daltonii FRC-32]|uniref:PilZ domain protein n=1 Tax=Geotalea daltonii (strain DSM 22248 / JCM 15807 / FRC-32) TaxID=316067 RepID=B9M085_GEODF|nr:PilZ domain-containing protein [Geotalea daltonii]ACM20865.1 PilZ domain protein [Geotalea daltonii FRC-32]
MTNIVNDHEQRGKTRYTVRVAIFRGPDEKRLLQDYSINMSIGGLYIETSDLLPVDTILHVEFKLPGKEYPVACRAKVAWTNGPDSPKKAALPTGMGIQFLTLTIEDMHTIRDFLTHYDCVPTW